MEELKYGLLDNKLVHINDVERGLGCNCVCPNCKAQLVARKGNVRAKHFAHYRLADCNRGTETALHLMAKEIVAKSCKVFVPYVPQTEYDFSTHGKLMVFESAILEKQLSDTVRGDVVLYTGMRFLNVEIKVTHEVDSRKLIELFNLGIPTIEVDLSDLNSDFTPELIEERLFGGASTHLIFSPKNKEIFAKRILGEWKKVYNSAYVNDCPISQARAYFMDYRNRGGACQCHECYSFTDYVNYGEEKLLCFGCLDGFDLKKLNKILNLEKDENHIKYVKLQMEDGSIIEKKR